MKSKHWLSGALGALATLALIGCNSGTNPVAPGPDGNGSPGISHELNGGATVYLAAGSVDALQAAIASAGSGGTVVVRSGSHTENNIVTITAPVTISGEAGAVMYFATTTYPTEYICDPGVHILNTSKVTVTGVEMRPVTAPGNTAILIENSSSVTVTKCKFYDHAWSVLVHKGDGNTISANTMVASPEWQTGGLPEAEGVINFNGTGTLVQGNDISGATFGLFASDTRGTAVRNTLHDCAWGTILCRWPEGTFQLPSGELIGSANSCTNWDIRRNVCTTNVLDGIIVIDGANNNHLQGNSCPGNGTYGIELVGETASFGFCTPTAFDNRVIASPFNDTVIKDCAQNSQITGGQLVDTSQDPCDAPCPASAPSLGSDARGRAQAWRQVIAARIAKKATGE